jgi:hypothetical protein
MAQQLYYEVLRKEQYTTQREKKMMILAKLGHCNNNQALLKKLNILITKF